MRGKAIVSTNDEPLLRPLNTSASASTTGTSFIEVLNLTGPGEANLFAYGTSSVAAVLSITIDGAAMADSVQVFAGFLGFYRWSASCRVRLRSSQNGTSVTGVAHYVLY